MATAEEKFHCAEREVALRVRVYARQIAAGKLTQEAAEREIALMREIASDYFREHVAGTRQRGHV